MARTPKPEPNGCWRSASLRTQPTALTGVSDWSDEADRAPGVRRVGIVHATSNALALSLYGASLASPAFR